MERLRQITSKNLTNLQKTLLKNYFNERYANVKNMTELNQILGTSNAKESYEALRNEYNDMIIEKQNKKKKLREQKQKQLKADKYYKENITVVNKDGGFYEAVKKFKGKTITITIYDKKGGKIIETRQEEIPTSEKDFINWWKSNGVWIIWKSSDTTIYTDYPDAVVYIYEGSKKINASKIKQYFKEGNVNCLLKPLFSWAEDCKENSKSNTSKKRYSTIINKLKKISNEIGNKGVSENEMIRISNDIQIDISIEKPILNKNDKYVVESKANKKPLKHFIMRNTKIDHVDINELLYLNNIEIVSQEELFKIKQQLECDEIYHEFSRNLNGINSINTLEKTWRLSNDFMEKINDFEIETGLNECYIDDIDNKNLSEFVKNGTHYNSTVDFDMDRTDAKHIDMKNAYANYNMCDYYQGFLGKITDWRETNKIEGVGLYQIHNLVIGDTLKKWNDKMKIYFNFNIYPSCELNFLKDNGASFDIMYGCWGVQPLDFDMNDYDFLFEKYDGIKGYAKYVGMCDSHHLTKRFSCYGNEELANSLDNVVFYKNNELTMKYPKQHNYHLGHFTAFILAYQRIQMLDELIYMNYDNLIRVCVDGIYYRGEYKIINPLFVPKEKMTFENIAGDSYVSNIIDNEQYWECGEYKPNNRLELYIGEGGNGKTHKNLLDKGLQRILYVSPSWKLASKKREEYNVDSEVWANILSTDPSKFGSIKRRYNVFIIDEVSMMTEENKQYIFDTYPNIKLIFCGDIGFQAPPFSLSDMIPVIEMNSKGFDIIYEEKINYRYKCEELKQLIKDVREMITYDRPNFEINNYVKSKIQHINNDDLKNMYSVKDMILSRSHEIKDNYTEMFKDLNKWYVTKNTRLFKNGMIIVGNKPDTTCEIRHAYTIHSIQGETAEEKLFINMEKSYNSRLLYTAISRARRIEQIYLIY